MRRADVCHFRRRVRKEFALVLKENEALSDC